MARIDVAPRVDNRDDGFARIVRLDAAHGSRARAVPKRAQIVRAVPAIAPQRLGVFVCHGMGMVAAASGASKLQKTELSVERKLYVDSSAKLAAPASLLASTELSYWNPYLR